VPFLRVKCTCHVTLLNEYHTRAYVYCCWGYNVVTVNKRWWWWLYFCSFYSFAHVMFVANSDPSRCQCPCHLPERLQDVHSAWLRSFSSKKTWCSPSASCWSAIHWLCLKLCHGSAPRISSFERRSRYHWGTQNRHRHHAGRAPVMPTLFSCFAIAIG